ncbi:MAG: right-handed parallel beta-helix repeat-containing protein [Planctomycetota bacterium]|jgi:hypothetical protein
MNRKWNFLIVLFLMGVLPAFGTVPVTVELVEVDKIWDKAPHSAFTDLVRWNNSFYCAFREGRGHVSTDGRIRILQSQDGNAWESAALVMLEGYDLRDAHLSVTPDGKLMLLGGAAPRKQDNQSAPTGTFASFSQDGISWTEPRIVVEPGRWLWCVTWHKEKAYGVSYAAGERMPYLELLVSENGTEYQCHVDRLYGTGYPTEVTLRFDDDTCYALVRRDRRGNEPSSALLGVSRPDYTKWRWHDLGDGFNGFGGPNFIKIPGWHWIGAGRMHDGGVHTALTYVDIKNGTMTRLMKLPSGRDTSYPGLVWYEGMLYVSYYSGHEGKTSIYLAKLKVEPKQGSEEGFGAKVNTTGDPIGGGKGYGRLVTQSDYLVKTLEELRAALKKAKSGQVVYVNDNAEINVTGERKIVIPSGVTVASGRGRGGSKGALLYSNELAMSPMFLAGGEKVRITGLQLRGPDQKRRTEQMRKLYKEGRYYSIPNSDGIISTHSNLEVDNCELWGWSHAAVFLKRGALKAHIHHNNIHHNQRSGLGYGVCLDQADALIEANLFDWCRHHIAGTGRPGTSYEARYNLVLENANGHSFDMHGGRDRKDGTDIAGDSIKIHHNTFRATGVRAFVIRGRPQQSAQIHHNWFLHSDTKRAVAQTNAVGNMNVYRNQFTADRVLKD